MDRWYVNDSGPSDEAVALGIRWLVEKARDLGVDHGAILIPTIQEGINNLERTIGRDRARALSRDREFSFDGVRVDVFAHRNPPWAYDGPIFVVWASPSGVGIAEELNPPALCALEWIEGELSEWKRTWGPRDIETDEPASRPETPAVIVGAVTGLSFGKDVLNVSDKRLAIDSLKILQVADVSIDPAVIQAEASRQGWSADAANRLRELAEKITSGVRVRGGSGRISKTRATDAVSRWEQLGAEQAGRESMD